MRTQMTKSELLKLSAILIVYLLGVVQVGIVRKVSAQDPTNLPLVPEPLAHTQQAQLAANDGTPGDNFGNAVAISNDTAVVGASRQPSGSNRGGAYVFVRSGASWSQQQKLLPVDVINGDTFGTSVGIDGDTIVAGAPAQSVGGASGRGAVYVFVRNGATWTQQQQLIASDGALGDNFGTAVAISGDTILVGALNHAVSANSRQGAAYVFVRSGANWTEQQKLTASDGLISDQLGGSVALVGNTAVVGARENNFGANRNGKVYVFLRSGTTWSQQQKLTASEGSSLDAFGGSVAISHNVDTIAIGAPDDNEGPVGDRGSVYVFVRSGTTWSEQQRLLGSLGLASGSGAHFGSSVDVDGDTVIAGAPELDPLGGNGRGSVYLFDRSGSTWTEQQRYLLSPAVLREFGRSVAMSGDSFIGGAPFDTVGSNLGQGAAYVFSTGKTLSIADVSIAEGNTGTTQATFTVTLSAAETTHVVVNYATLDGTATAGSDYVAASGTVTFNPGEVTKTFNVTINGDTLFEANETFFVDLSNPVNANITQGRATGTITNDDPPPSISINDVSQAEGNIGTTNFTFTVTLSAISGLPAMVNYATADGTATASSDYQSTSGALTFDPGQTSKQITVAANGDTQNEADETFQVNLSSPTNSTITKAQGVGTILNDDAALPIVQFSAANYDAQEDCTFVTVTVNRIGTPLPAGTVDYFTSDVTANGRRDYIAAIGKLRFAAGEASKSFPLLINEDSYLEGPETFNVTLTNPSGVMLGAPSVATVTIADDATEPATNAIDDPRNFAGQHYHDFLNRQPDQSGWDFWTNETASCGNDPQCLENKRIFVSAAFYISIEFQETGYLVERLYKSAYGDAIGTSTFNGAHQLPVPIVRFNEFFPDTQEIGQGVVVGAQGWEQQLENNKQAFVTEFVQRSRFTTAFPTTLTPAQYVDQLSTNAGNVLSASERATAIALFGGAADTSNMTARAQALRQVAEDQDLRNAEFNRAFVLMQYFGYLRRDPNVQPDTDYSGFDFWLTKLNQFNGNFVHAEMVKAFIVSGEYIQRFGPPSPTLRSTVVIDRPYIFFPAISGSTQLRAQMLDAQGVPSPSSVTWTSTAPDKVSVDATGKLMALAIGSTQIIAEAGGIRSAPTLVIVAQPQPGALLVTDAQVVSVGPPLGLAAGDSPGVGTQYEVTLQGVSAPAPGTLMIAAETAPIAGKVIATRQDAAGLVVTLALAPLYQLFGAYDINWTIDLSAFPLEAVPPQSAQATLGARWNAERRGKLRALSTAGQLAELEPFRAFDCDGSIKPQLVDAPIQLAPEVKLSLVVTDRPGYSKHALEGSATLTGTAGLKLKAGFNATGKCEAKAQVKLPVFGAASVIVMPAVNFGLGAELKGEVLLVQGELGAEGKVGFSPVVGWECDGATPPCRSLDAITPFNEFKTKSKIPSQNDMQAKVSSHFYILAGLDFAILAGLANAEILEARIGPKQSFDLAFEEDQAARADYASSYDLKLNGVVKPGAALKKAIEMAIDDDTTEVKFKAEFSTDISESPKGTLSVNKTRVRPDERVIFTVDLRQETVDYSLLGHNVTGVELYRKRDEELEFTPWKSMSLIATHRATYQWVPTISDAGMYDFAAFVNTQIPVPLLEIAPNSIQKVEVSCFSSSPATKFGSKASLFATGAAIGTQAPICTDTWFGNATYIINTPGLPTANIATRSTITWNFDPAISVNGTTYYTPSGTFDLTFNHPDDCVSVLSPNVFTIVSDPLTLSTLGIFNDGVNPPSYSFLGSQLVNFRSTVSCPGREPVVTEFRGFPVSYASGNGPFTEGQLRLFGSFDDGAITSTWDFRRP